MNCPYQRYGDQRIGPPVGFGTERRCSGTPEMIQDRQNGFPLIGIEADDAPCDAELLIARQRPNLVRCESVELRRIEANCDRARGPVTVGGGKHILKIRNEREPITVFFASQRIPTVAILNGATRGVRVSAPDDDRWVRLLNWLWVGNHWAEIDKCTVVFSPILRPDSSHGFDPLLHQLMARGESRAMIFHLLFVPAITDAEKEAAAGAGRLRRGVSLSGSDHAD
jgi:hypothetical protein